MATKRMFSRDIVGSDAFLDMPDSSQLLYFHLGMEADDDGFIGNPKKIIRGLGSKEDDLKVLISKRFVIFFETGVVVIKHHRINNNWDAHNCKRTAYIEEFSQLNIKDNKAYTLDKTQGIPVQSVSRLLPVGNQSLEENKGEEKRRENNTEKAPAFSGKLKATKVKTKKIDIYKANPTHSQVIKLFSIVTPDYHAFYDNATEHKAIDTLLKSRNLPEIEDILKKAVDHNKAKFVASRDKIYKPSELLRNWQRCEDGIKATGGNGVSPVLKTENSTQILDKLKRKTTKLS